MQVNATSGHASDLTSKIIAIWSELFPGQDVKPDKDFFYDLGGHSLLLIEMLIAVNAVCETEIAIEVFLGEPTVDSLVRFIETHKSTRP